MRDTGAHVLAVLAMVGLFGLVGYAGMTLERASLRVDACAAACRKYNSGRHTADNVWCVCKNGIALKYDESGLYGKVTP